MEREDAFSHLYGTIFRYNITNVWCSRKKCQANEMKLKNGIKSNFENGKHRNDNWQFHWRSSSEWMHYASRDKLSNLLKRLSQSSEIEKQTNNSWHIELQREKKMEFSRVEIIILWCALWFQIIQILVIFSCSVWFFFIIKLIPWLTKCI